jgi:hypothetical protein
MSAANINFIKFGDNSTHPQLQQQQPQQPGNNRVTTTSFPHADVVTFRRVLIEDKKLATFTKEELRTICLKQAGDCGYLLAYLKEDEATVAYKECERDVFETAINVYVANQGHSSSTLGNKALLFNTAWEQGAEYERRVIKLSNEYDKLKYIFEQRMRNNR